MEVQAKPTSKQEQSKCGHRIKVYTSGLSDKQWETIRELLPLKQTGAGRPLEIDMR